MIDPQPIQPLEYQAYPPRLTAVDLLKIVLLGIPAVGLQLLGVLVLLWGLFCLLGGPDPMPDYARTNVGVFVGTIFLASLLWIVTTLLLSHTFARATSNRPVKLSYRDFIFPSAMISGGILMWLPFMPASTLFFLGETFWGRMTSWTLGAIFLVLSAFGAYMAVMGFIRLGTTRRSTN